MVVSRDGATGWIDGEKLSKKQLVQVGKGKKKINKLH